MDVLNLPCLTGSPDSIETFIECPLCASGSVRIIEVAKVNDRERE